VANVPLRSNSPSSFVGFKTTFFSFRNGVGLWAFLDIKL
jgi:hypothetical protein